MVLSNVYGSLSGLIQFFNSGIPVRKTQFCLLNITIENVSEKQSLATTNEKYLEES